MNYNDYISYTSEITQLEKFLEKMPKTSVINRIGLESRLKRAKAAIADAPRPEKPAEKLTARLTFRGNPVVGRRAIEANFAAKATELFTDALALIASKSDNDNVAGSIRNKKDNQLLITGTAVGSFGFQLEVPQSSTEDLFPKAEPVAEALQQVQTLFEAASKRNIEEIAELVDGISKRALKKLSGFLGYLATQKATCGLGYKGKQFRFKDLEQVHSVMECLKEDNIKDTEEQLTGEFVSLTIGNNAKFQFKIGEGENPVTGKFEKGIEITEGFAREHLWKTVTVTFDVRTVGQGTPRYTLSRLENIEMQ